MLLVGESEINCIANTLLNNNNQNNDDVYEANCVRDGCARFISEDRVNLPLHMEYVGDTLVEFSRADIRTFQHELDELRKFRSEVSVSDIQEMISTVGDKVRDTPSKFLGQLDSLSKMVKMLSDKSFDAYLTIDGQYLADLLSQALMALKLIAAEPSVTNLTLVFTCCVTKLNLPKDTYQKVVDFITKSIEVAIASISSISTDVQKRFRSESAVRKIVDVLSNLCNGVGTLVEDKVIDVVVNFLAKIVAFWATLSGGFTEDDFKLSSIDKIIGKIRSIIADGGDLLEALMGAYEFVTQHFFEFVKGDFSSLFFGKAETKAYESRVSKVKRCYVLLKNGSHDILKEEFGFTPNSFDAEVTDLIKIGDRQMKKARDAQRPALKRMLDEIREIQTDRLVKQAQIQSKMSAVGICFVGGSGVGKSLLMEQTAKTLIRAAGEIPSRDQIVTGQMSDKFDSNELPHHLVLMYDDVANNSANENFDKLLNAVNSQSRPFLKASVEEKGVMFPGNIGCVISTNVLGFKAQKSNCPDSLGRRFIHIRTSIKPHLIEEICVPGTKRIDPKKASAGNPRFDIWKFEVFEFVTFDPINDPENGLPEGIEEVSEDGIRFYARRVHWTDKPEKEYTFYDLAQWIGSHAKEHFRSQKGLLAKMRAASDEQYCEKCCVPMSYCTCCVQSEFCGIDDGVGRIVDNYNTMLAFSRRWWEVTKFRSALGLSLALCPINIKRVFITSLCAWLIISVWLRLSLGITLLCIAGGTFGTTAALMIYAWRRTYNAVANRVGVLTHVAQNTVDVISEYRNKIFVGAGLVSFAYLVYRAFRPRSEYSTYREQMPETIRASFLRAEKARTTPLDNIMPHMKRDLGVITVIDKGGPKSCLAFPIEANFYLTVSHMIPKEGEFEVTIVHENAMNPTVAKQKLSGVHVHHFEGKDLCLLQIPSAVPRRGYLDYLNGRDQHLGSQTIRFVSLDLDTHVRYETASRLQPHWSMFSNTVKTDKATLVKPYQYPVSTGTKPGMCGSLIVDFSKSLIYGFHVAGDGRTGLCSTISREMIQEALAQFNGFIPANRGDLQLGSQTIEKGLGFVELSVDDPTVDKSVEDHNCIVEGILPGASATFKDPYMPHPYHESVEAAFGPPKSGPPQQVNHPYHKRKALTKLSSPNQEFSADEVEFARKDYVSDILDKIDSMKKSERVELSRKLTIQEALDGIGEKSLGGIDNSTSVGFPYKGKKMNYLERDPFDETQPLVPRKLVEYNGTNIEEEVWKMIDTYRQGKTCRPLFKCSMKTNELLPNHKFKARVFMGSNFPFLLVCRMYLAPFIRMAARNKFLFESAKGINMDSVEAEELYDYLKDNEERIVALDYSAFDQTMSVQVSSAVSACIIDIMRKMQCTEEHITVVRGILTDINYPNLHFFGTILQLANSDPSGNPITTELNGGVNSIYLRIFFYRLYPELRGKVRYRKAIKSMTYGDDNISSVPEPYAKFNGTNIVKVGKEVGLTITMADKDAEVTDFTHLTESDFLKRKFRYCPDLGRIRAPLLKQSILKSFYYMKKSSPETAEELFRQNVDGALRKMSQHGREPFEDLKAKLVNIAKEHDVSSTIYWWNYDELIEHDRRMYYDDYRGYSLADAPQGLAIETGFKSESFERPKTTHKKIPYLGLGMVAEFVLAIIPFFKSGRFSDIGLSFNAYTWILSLITSLFYLVPRAELEPWDRTWWLRLGFSLRDSLANLWLSRESDVIRRQPACIVLEGPAGSGKTTLALALVKYLFEPIGGIQKHEIIVLNEEDNFQSEYRSHHRVVILDDVANTKLGSMVSTNPLRRVIDFVNNIPKRALSPEADLKGIIKIQPELVILTSNVRYLIAADCSNCVDSIYRRAKFIRVERNDKQPGVGLDLGIWKLTELPQTRIKSSTTGSKAYGGYIGFDESKERVFKDFQCFVEHVKNYCMTHWAEQDHLVSMVDELFSPKQRSWFSKFKSESWDSDLISSLQNLPRGCGPDELLSRMDLQASAMALSGKYELAEIPQTFIPYQLPWYTRIWHSLLLYLGFRKFRSEVSDEKLKLLKENWHILERNYPGYYYVCPDYVLQFGSPCPELYVKRLTSPTLKMLSFVGNSRFSWNLVHLDQIANITPDDMEFYAEFQAALSGKTSPRFKSESLEDREV